MREIWDELLIKVGEAKKRMNTLNEGREFPIMDGRGLDRVHTDLFLANDHTKKFDLRSVKDTFCQFQREIMSTETKEDMASSFMES